MGAFDGIRNARVAHESNYGRPGTYRAEILSVRLTKSGKGKEFLAIDMRCVECLDPGMAYTLDPQTGVYELTPNKSPHRPGETFVRLVKNENPNIFFGEVKQFLSACCEVAPDDITEDHAYQVVSDEQPLAGLVIELRIREQLGRDSKKPYAKVHYIGPVGGEAVAESS